MSTTTPMPLTAPLAQRLLAWADERWPPANAVAVFLVYLTALLFGEALTSDGALSITLGDLAAFPGVLAYSLLIRVLDEHKDYEVDLVNHPERVLQSGLVRLGHLKVVGAVAFALPALVSLLEDGGLGPVTTWWAILMGWTFLMWKEFFVADWLRERRIVYAITHIAATPLLILWIAAMGADGRSLPGSVLWLGLLMCLISFAAEFARKLEAPEDERPTLDSYTKILGTGGAALCIAVCATLSAPVAGALLDAAGEGSTAAYAAIAVAVVPALAGAARFASRPTRENTKWVEALTRLTVLLFLLVLIAALLAGRGLS